MAWRRGQTYSQDLRDRVLAAEKLTARQGRSGSGSACRMWSRRGSGWSAPEPRRPAAEASGSRASCCRSTGRCRSGWRGRRTRPWPEHREWLAEAHGAVAGLTTVAGNHPGSSFADARKKSLRAAERSRPDVAEARRQWIGPAARAGCEAAGSSSMRPGPREDMTRLHGRSLRGTRLVGSAAARALEDHETFLAGSRHDGIGWRRSCSTGRSTAKRSWPGPSSSWRRNCGRATSSSPTSWAATRGVAARQAIRGARGGADAVARPTRTT